MTTQFPLPGLPAAETPDATPGGRRQAERPARRRRPTREQLLEGLNEPQREAVVHEGAPLLVVAGAGSGKTRVLTRRIAWLISERDAHPGSVLAITFTNKAAAEMRERVEELVGGRAQDHVGQHVPLRLRADPAQGDRQVRLQVELLDLRRRRLQAADDAGLPRPRPRREALPAARDPQLGQQRRRTSCRTTRTPPRTPRNGQEETYAAAYAEYQRRLRQANALDFDDLLMMTVHLFRAFPAVRENWRRRFRHVLVDEYQDTNHAQYALIHELCADSLGDSRCTEVPETTRVEPAELMVVGDADQSIYAFRGANIRNIMDFEQDFPNARDDHARAELPLHPDDPHRRQRGDQPQRGPQAEEPLDRRRARATASSATSATTSTTRRGSSPRRSTSSPTRATPGPGDVAVFYRTNAQSRVFEEVFIRVGMPYRVVGGVRFYERREVRDALAYLRVLVNPADSVSLRRILNTPKRGIGERAEACIEGAGPARPDHLLGGAAARRGRPRPREPLAERDQAASSTWSSSSSRWSRRGSGSTSCSSRR